MKHYEIPAGQSEEFYEEVDKLFQFIREQHTNNSRVVDNRVNECCKLCDGVACENCKVYAIGESNDTYAISPVMRGRSVYYFGGKYYYTCHQGDWNIAPKWALG